MCIFILKIHQISQVSLNFLLFSYGARTPGMLFSGTVQYFAFSLAAIIIYTLQLIAFIGDIITKRDL